MVIRRLTIEDYPSVVYWWKKQGRAILAWEVLPTLGFIVEDENEKIAASWLYCTDSVTGFVSWTTINTECYKKKIVKGLHLLQEAISESAKQTGCKILFQFSGGGGFSRILKKTGWKDSLIKHDFLLKEL